MEILSSIPQATFDKRGELNAQDKRHALDLAAKYLSEMAKSSSLETLVAEEAVSNEMSTQDRERYLAGINVPQQRMALGQAMANPIRRYLDYRGVMRKSMKVDPLAQGAIPIYDRDVEGIAAITLSANGSVVESKIYGQRVVVPVFEIAANPTVRIRELKIRRFNMIDRVQVKTRQFIQEREDDYLITTLTAASTVENALQASLGAGVIVKTDLMRIKRQVERWDLVVRNFFMSIFRFNDILIWPPRDVDPVTLKSILDTGLYAKIWNSNIYVTKRMPNNTVMCTADPEFVGVIPVYQDIEVMPSDEPKQLKLGWVFSELWGVFVSNPRGVARLNVT